MFDIKNSEVYFRDKFVPFKEANLSIASSPVLYGLSIYTVFNVCLGKKTNKLLIFRLREHHARLVNSAKIMDFDSFERIWGWPKFEKTMLELLGRNKIDTDVLVRVTVYIDEIIAGTRMHGLKNSLSAYIYPKGAILPSGGVNLCVSSWQRNADNAIPAKAKINGSYVNASLMKNEALLNGYDDAISLDHNGHVAESTVANLFIVREGILSTPDTSTDILEGITRDSLIKLAKKLKIEVQERSIDRTELYKSDEAFLCGSSADIVPVLSIDKRQIGNGLPGPITKQLIEKYTKLLRGDSKDFAQWLSAV